MGAAELKIIRLGEAARVLATIAEADRVVIELREAEGWPTCVAASGAEAERVVAALGLPRSRILVTPVRLAAKLGIRGDELLEAASGGGYKLLTLLRELLGVVIHIDPLLLVDVGLLYLPAWSHPVLEASGGGPEELIGPMMPAEPLRSGRVAVRGAEVALHALRFARVGAAAVESGRLCLAEKSSQLSVVCSVAAEYGASVASAVGSMVRVA